MGNTNGGVAGQTTPKTALVFVIQAYQSEAPDGSLADIVTLELVDKTTESALKRAKTLITKKFYRLSRVIETFYDKS